MEEEQKRKANQLSLTNFWMAKQVICPKTYRIDRNQIEVFRYYSLFLVTFRSDPYLKEKL